MAQLPAAASAALMAVMAAASAWQMADRAAVGADAAWGSELEVQAAMNGAHAPAGGEAEARERAGQRALAEQRCQTLQAVNVGSSGRVRMRRTGRVARGEQQQQQKQDRGHDQEQQQEQKQG